MIPKTIHYCWFGGNSFSKLHEECLATWTQHLPDYELKLWNEYNSPMDHPFVKAAYKDVNYAFVSDYVRLYAIYNEGGIYLDTDMFVLKAFDSLLKNECFLGVEDEDGVNASIIGAQPKSKFLQMSLNFYDSIKYDRSSLDFISIPRNLQKVLRSRGWNESEVTIYKEEYFYPYPWTSRLAGDLDFKKYITDKSFAVHLWDASWIPLDKGTSLINKLIKIIKGFIK